MTSGFELPRFEPSVVTECSTQKIMKQWLFLKRKTKRFVNDNITLLISKADKGIVHFKI